jgi:hypothetical protein
MCAGCAMTAMASASGARAWLQSRGWLSPRALRRVTVGAFAVAVTVSTIGLSGSTKAAPPHGVTHGAAVSAVAPAP